MLTTQFKVLLGVAAGVLALAAVAVNQVNLQKQVNNLTVFPTLAVSPTLEPTATPSATPTTVLRFVPVKPTLGQPSGGALK